MTVRKIALSLLIAAGTVLPVNLMRAQSDAAAKVQGGILDVSEQTRQRPDEQLEGTWISEIVPLSPPGAPPFRVYRSFARGGVLYASNRDRPLDGLQHGVWEHLGGNNFAWSQVQDRFDVNGNFIGTFTSRANGRLIDRDTLVSVTSVEFRDAAGNLTLARCSTNRATRFKQLPLAEQCANLPLE